MRQTTSSKPTLLARRQRLVRELAEVNRQMVQTRRRLTDLAKRLARLDRPQEMAA
jgi:hypothetical protein